MLTFAHLPQKEFKTPSSVLETVVDLSVSILKMNINLWCATDTGNIYFLTCVIVLQRDNHSFLFLSSEVGIFDLRNTSTRKEDDEEEVVSSVVRFPTASKGVRGAFFSPLTGQYALTTSVDNTLKLYDVRQGSDAQCKLQVKLFITPHI